MSIIACAVIVVVSMPVAAKDEAPTEAAVEAATRNFMGAIGARQDAFERDDLLRRFVDARGFAERALGADFAALPETDQKQVLDSVARFLSRGLLCNWTLPEDVHRVDLSVTEAVGATRSVSYVEQGKRVVLVWRGSLLVDFGGGDEGLLSKLLRRQRAKLGVGVVDFARALEKAVGTIRENAAIVWSKDNIRTLLTLMIARRTMKVRAGWPRYSGKRFVLSVLATGDVDRSNPKNLEIFFSPGDKQRSVKKAGGPDAYKGITKQALREGKLPVAHLTSYAGRRNLEREHVVTPAEEKAGTAVIADLSFPDIAIVGFTNGAVRTMTRKQLGLGPEDPIVVGDKSKSELLRSLSSD